jgi:hypothetical protein
VISGRDFKKTARELGVRNRPSINPQAEIDPRPMNKAAIRRALERLASTEATSGRGAPAKVTALRTLERIDRSGKPRSVPVDDEGRFHPGSASWWELDRCDADETRGRWRENWLERNR